MKQIPLILASSSPYRENLLRQLQLSFACQRPDVDETPLPNETPPLMVRRLAVNKVKAVAAQHSKALIIGADQTAVCEDRQLDKPYDLNEAREQLQFCSGKTVTLYTGLALYNSSMEHLQVDVVPYYVTYRKLNDDQISAYLASENVLGCTGSLRVEGLGVALLQSMQGDDPSALIGLPWIRLVEMLAAEGVKIMSLRRKDVDH